MALAMIGASFSNAMSRYNKALTSYPVTTNATTGFSIAAIGDLICQLGYETDKPYSLRRTVEMGIVRAAVMSPFLVVYFPFLNRLVPGKTMDRVLLRVLADQCIGSPVSISMIFAATCLIRGQPEAIIPRIQQSLIPTMINGAMYWPFVHTLNFRFVSLAHQPFVAHAASLWWNAILSYRANSSLHKDDGKNPTAQTVPTAPLQSANPVEISTASQPAPTATTALR